MIDLQRGKLLDTMEQIFLQYKDLEALQIGWILANILGLKQTNLEIFMQRNYFDIFYEQILVYKKEQPVLLLESCLLALANLSF